MSKVRGRPSELTEEIIDTALAWVEERSNMGTHVLLPTIEGLAIHLGINRDTIYDWEAKGDSEEATELQKDFSDIVKELRSWQAEKLMQNALQNKYNPMISKLLLSKHGYVEKSEQDITTGGDKLASTDPVLAAEFASFMKGKK